MTKRRNVSSSSAASAATAESDNPQSESDTLNNEAIQRCADAWQRTFDLASIKPDDESLALVDEDDDFASEQAAIAFREALPPLAGYENIRDFIACVTYAMVNGNLYWAECHEFLAAAKIAMALLKAQPKSPTPAT